MRIKHIINVSTLYFLWCKQKPQRSTRSRLFSRVGSLCCIKKSFDIVSLKRWWRHCHPQQSQQLIWTRDELERKETKHSSRPRASTVHKRAHERQKCHDDDERNVIGEDDLCPTEQVARVLSPPTFFFLSKRFSGYSIIYFIFS